jgi:hypothetical protein
MRTMHRNNSQEKSDASQPRPKIPVGDLLLARLKVRARCLLYQIADPLSCEKASHFSDIF